MLTLGQNHKNMNLNRWNGTDFVLRMVLLLTISLMTLIGLPSCKTTDQEKQAAKIAKVEKSKKKQAQKEYEKAQKRHMKIQDKKTRKRMKGNRSKMMEQTNVKKKSWWKRIFGKKEKSCQPPK